MTSLRTFGPHPGPPVDCAECEQVRASEPLPERTSWALRVGAESPIVEHFLILVAEHPCLCGAYLSEGRPPAHPGMTESLRRQFPIGSQTPDAWVAANRNDVHQWPYDTHRYDDPEVEAWIMRATELLNRPHAGLEESPAWEM